MKGYRNQEEIMSSWLGNLERPVVSICCATFNHADYIRATLAGFLSQETSFPFEIIIRDDASSDGTVDILREYQKYYPKIFRVILNTTNRFCLGERPIHIWPTIARGEYVSLCEGDDFWVEANKLQTQVELLQKYPMAVASVAGTRVCKQKNTELDILSETGLGVSGLLDFERLNENYYHTSTYVIRTEVFNAVVKDYFSGHTLFGDAALSSILISMGPFVVYPEIVSVYRVTGTGIWTGLNSEKRLIWECKAAKKLSRMLEGKHARRQLLLVFIKQLALARLYFQQRRVKDVLRQLPGLFQNSWIYLLHLVAVKSKAWLEKRIV